MKSAAFTRALQATGYLGPEGQPAPGLLTADNPNAVRLRSIMKDQRIGLNADAVFTAQNNATGIFKDSGDAAPNGIEEITAARDLAQRLIGRCIFTWYLLAGST
jgi:hypothetical protein